MKRIEDYERLDEASAEYPSGAIKDASGIFSNDGTRINKAFYNDVFQAHMKAVRDTGVSPSGDYDNETNGYQLFQAMFATEWSPSPQTNPGVSIVGGKFKTRLLMGGTQLQIYGELLTNNEGNGNFIVLGSINMFTQHGILKSLDYRDGFTANVMEEEPSMDTTDKVMPLYLFAASQYIYELRLITKKFTTTKLIRFNIIIPMV